MKKLKKLDIYIKLAFATLAVVVAGVAINFFLLMRVYGLVGMENKSEAITELNRIESITNVTTPIIFTGVVLIFVFLAIGIFRVTKREAK